MGSFEAVILRCEVKFLPHDQEDLSIVSGREVHDGMTVRSSVMSMKHRRNGHDEHGQSNNLCGGLISCEPYRSRGVYRAGP